MEKKVLFVDDEPQMLKILANLARSHGYDPVTADEGMEALLAVEREHIRVCFLDLRMPKMDGMELCREIKKLAPNAEIFALSAYVNAFTPEQYAEAGFTGHFEKPFKIDQILNACRDSFVKLEKG